MMASVTSSSISVNARDPGLCRSVMMLSVRGEMEGFRSTGRSRRCVSGSVFVVKQVDQPEPFDGRGILRQQQQFVIAAAAQALYGR